MLKTEISQMETTVPLAWLLFALTHTNVLLHRGSVVDRSHLAPDNEQQSCEVKGNKATFEKRTQHDAKKQTGRDQPSSKKHEEKNETVQGVKKMDHHYMMHAGSWQQLPGTQTADTRS